MTREEAKNKIVQHLREKVAWTEANPNQTQQFHLGSIYDLFPMGTEPAWKHQKTYELAREIFHELELSGFIYEGQAGGSGDSASYPWFTITEYGKQALQSENWLPYDPEGYISVLREKISTLDDITLAYISESVAAYNRRNLLSATLTLGVASENLMLLLIEAYTNWLSADPARQAAFKNKIEDKWISTQYREFKKEFAADVKSMPEFKADWETYLDGVFNFIRLNRNDAGHPTGKQFEANVVYANLQIFAEYTVFITKLTTHLNS